MNTPPATTKYKNHRFPVEIISHAVWLYSRFCLSFQEVEERLFERGVVVTYEKKELVGNLYRPGQIYTQEVVKTFGHDFPSAALGVVIPHGLYDLKRNGGHVNLGTSHDTSEFACDSLRRWWESQGQAAYPRETSLLLLWERGAATVRTNICSRRTYTA